MRRGAATASTPMPRSTPASQEICNLVDDNCDGRNDERVRPTCGVGSCRRNSPTCDMNTCTPGLPEVEACNLLDDDCDGEVDEDSCGAQMICLLGACVPDDGSGGGPDARRPDRRRGRRVRRQRAGDRNGRRGAGAPTGAGGSGASPAEWRSGRMRGGQPRRRGPRGGGGLGAAGRYRPGCKSAREPVPGLPRAVIS